MRPAGKTLPAAPPEAGETAGPDGPGLALNMGGDEDFERF
jgi:hypothetical protein